MLTPNYNNVYKFNHLFVDFTDKTDLTSTSTVTGAVHIVETAQLPPKFRRTVMDEAEISAINVCNMFDHLNS